MRKLATIALLAAFAMPLTLPAPLRNRAPARAAAQAAVPAGETDQTLHAMHDEMERARTRLVLAGVGKPFYLEYRLLDLDVRSVTATFGALVSSSTSRIPLHVRGRSRGRLSPR